MPELVSCALISVFTCFAYRVGVDLLLLASFMQKNTISWETCLARQALNGFLQRSGTQPDHHFVYFSHCAPPLCPCFCISIFKSVWCSVQHPFSDTPFSARLSKSKYEIFQIINWKNDNHL